MFVKFKTDKDGRKRAYKWSQRQIRWFPMKLDEAELAVKMGKAVECKDTATPEPKN